MLYAAVSLDKPGQLELRIATRPPHVAWLEGLGDQLKLAGPMLDETGENPIGSLVIIEAESLAAARAVFAADPYVKAGLFATADVRAWRHTFGKLG